MSHNETWNYFKFRIFAAGIVIGSDALIRNA